MTCLRNLLEINQFKSDSFRFNESTGFWSNPNGNSVLSTSREQQKYSNLSSLKLLALVAGQHVIRSPQCQLDNFLWDERESRLGVWIYPSAKINVDLDYVHQVGVNATTLTNSYSVRALMWTWIDIEAPSVSTVQNRTGQLDIKLDYLNVGDSVFIAAPVFTSPDMISDNPFTPEIWRRLPEYYRQADIAQNPS